MKQWKEYKLGEVGSLKRGKSKHRPRYAPELFGGQYPFIQTGEVKAAQKYITNFEQTYSEKGLAQSQLWKKGTLCITIAANIAEIAILGIDACFPDSIIGFIPDESKCDLDFAFYTLKHFQKELQSFGEGSVQDNINLGTFEQITFPFPPLPEQRAIASVLSSLDDKIDLLHRQNATLEALAETLFRQWFVEEAEESWEKGKLGDLINVKYGKDHKNLQEGNIPVYGSGGVMRYADKALYTQESVLIPRKGTLNNVLYIDEPFWTVDTMFYTEMKQPNLAKFIFHFVKEKDLASMNVGSAVPSMTTEILNNLPLNIPPLEKLEQFEQSAEPMYRKIKSNHTQIRTLTQLRDTLLPKLMSGEVRVSEQDEKDFGIDKI